MLYITKNHIPNNWSQGAQVFETNKNAMLFYCYELCNFSIYLTVNVDRQNCTNTSGAMDSELDVCV